MNKKEFKISNGDFIMDGMAQTKEFVQGNTDYIANFVLEFQRILGKSGTITTVCQEPNWAFSVKIDQSEFGRIANGAGSYIEGKNVPLNQLVSDLAQSN